MVTANKRVLVVDDEAIVCESYERVLAEEGYLVRTARTGREALAACQAEPFDVLFADLKMPDMDGLEVARRVKQEFPRVQILIITGYPSPESAAEALGLGVFEYLRKPLTPKQLSAITAAALSADIESREMERLAERTDATGESGGELLGKTSETPAVPKKATQPAAEPVQTQKSGVETNLTAADPTAAPVELVESVKSSAPATEGVRKGTATDVLKTVGALAVAPLIGLAYVLLLSLVGFGMLLAAVGVSIPERLRWAKS